MASVPSPESTVTSLLASSGHLKSSLSSDSKKCFRYRDREYESATEALDAYISDFQRSLRAPNMSTGRLQLPKDPVTPIFPDNAVRNKDVLEEMLTDGELDFLNLPVGRQQRDPDSLSLTTEDLLVLPSDGSMPVTRTSAYLSQHMADPMSRSTSFRSRSLRTQDLRESQAASQRRRGPGRQEFLSSNPNTHQTRRQGPDAISSHHYPRWLTNLKSEMNFSGLSSIPDQAYPTWLRDCEAKSVHHGQRNLGKLGRSRIYPASFQATSSRDHKSESLILKAEEALVSPSLGHEVRDRSSSPHTEDILDLDRSWDNPAVTFKSPVPVGGAEDQDNINKPGTPRMEAAASSSSGYSSRRHPGPVEALKQMLFSLQAVEQGVTQNQQGTSNLETKKTGTPEEHLDACMNPDVRDEYESAPGGQSLQRALHHLGRLKSLVDDMNNRKERGPQEL
ncbi:hypothetical protein GJAV_G00041850 [Gymnothorax javanicus]|nr:hypothetical protein GJAV_G00041850 [Gymnothorax javanicus]